MNNLSFTGAVGSNFSAVKHGETDEYSSIYKEVSLSLGLTYKF